MTLAIFEEWFFKLFVPSVRCHLRKHKLEEKAVLYCAERPPGKTLITSDGRIRIRVLYLPKNTTSKIQPLDQGIILTFKVHYRRHLIKAIIMAMGVTGYLTSLTITDMVYMAGSAWRAVTESTIYNCWSKVFGSVFSDEATVEAEPQDEITAVQFRQTATTMMTVHLNALLQTRCRKQSEMDSQVWVNSYKN